jgi:hypothetical protein
MSQAALEIASALGVEWGRAPNGSSAQSYAFMCGAAEKLSGRAAMKTGPVAGNWSLLAAAAACRVRQASNAGALGWSVATMLEHEFDQVSQTWKNAKCDAPPHKGSMAKAIGFDWRPGVPIDGIVALSLFGQRNGAGYMNQASQDAEVARDIADFGLVTGIANPAKWACDNAQAAAEFTRLVLKNPKINAARCFLTVWDTALARNPAMAKHIPEALKIELLSSITARFRLSSTWVASLHTNEIGAFGRIAGALFPGLSQESFKKDNTLSGLELRAALLWHLALSNSNGAKFHTQMDLLEYRIGDLSKADLEVVSSWVDGVNIGQDLPAAQARVEQWKLRQVTPEASAKKKSGGPRL